jgi:hypothetical protein
MAYHTIPVELPKSMPGTTDGRAIARSSRAASDRSEQLVSRRGTT